MARVRRRERRFPALCSFRGFLASREAGSESRAPLNRRAWQAESTVIGGFLEIEPDALESQKQGQVRARAEVFVPIRSIKSVDKDGRPYSDKIDEAWYGALRARNNPEAKIAFYLSALTRREPAATNEASAYV